jgi:AcrR family transcriptional regulator
VAFAERGHDGVNLKAHILEPAGVSVGSFYHQFSDKTELLIALLDEAVDAWRTSVLGDGVVMSGEGLEDALRAILTRFVGGVEAGEELWRIHLRERSNPEPRIRERVVPGREAWARGLTDRLRDALGPEVPADAVQRSAQLVVVLCIGLATTYLDRPKSQRTAVARRALVEDTTAFAVGGIERLAFATVER